MSFISFIFSERSLFDLIAKAISKSFKATFSILLINSLSGTGADQSQGSFEASFAKSLIILITGCIALWPSNTASSITFSGNSFASDSTINTAESLPATTKSNSLFSS